MNRRETDSSGVTCEYTPIQDLLPGQVVIIGWRTTVARVEIENDRARVWWKGLEQPDQWNPLGTLMPVEVTEDGPPQPLSELHNRQVNRRRVTGVPGF